MSGSYFWSRRCFTYRYYLPNFLAHCRAILDHHSGINITQSRGRCEYSALLVSISCHLLRHQNRLASSTSSVFRNGLFFLLFPRRNRVRTGGDLGIRHIYCQFRTSDSALNMANSEITTCTRSPPRYLLCCIQFWNRRGALRGD